MSEADFVRPQLETPNDDEQENGLKVFSLRFEKRSCQLVVGTDKGYRLVSYRDPARPTVKRGLMNESIKFIELIPKTKILVYVTTEAPLKVNFYERAPASREYISPRNFNSQIVALRSSLSRIAITIESGIYLYSNQPTNFMTKLHFVLFNNPNPNGLVDLSEHDFNAYIAYPTTDTAGIIEIFDCSSLKSKVVFEAHQNPIVAISFSPTGRSLATASEKGTLIRVHIVFTGECVYEFRRTLLGGGSINSLGFGLDSTFLGVTSDATTIHIFKLAARSNGPNIVMDVIHRAAEAYLPTGWTKLLNQERAFALARLPVPKMDTISLVHKNDDGHYVIVATYDGFVYTYNLDDVNGGECNLIKAVAIDKEKSIALDDEWVFVRQETQEDKDLGF